MRGARPTGQEEIMAMTAGRNLRSLREKLGLAKADIESLSAKIGEKYRNEEFSIPPSRLSDIETKGVLPSCYRLYSLAVIYALPLTQLMAQYGVPHLLTSAHNVQSVLSTLPKSKGSPVGLELRHFREKAGITMRDVERLSAEIADRQQNEEFSIPSSRLSDIETKGVLPNIYRIYTLAAIYKIDILDLLKLYGVDAQQADSDRALLGLSDPDFEVTFSPDLTLGQITTTLEALAGYYRACGGLGFQIDFEFEELLVAEPTHV
jgi:transcriptional regulator with XRE-family HTH domain